MLAFIARFHTFFLSWSNCIFLAFYSSFSYSILFLVVLYSALDRIAQRSPPIEFAPSSSPLPYAVFAPTLFKFDPIKSSSTPSSRVRPLIE